MSPLGNREIQDAANMTDNFEKCYNFSTSLLRKMILVPIYRFLGTMNPMEEETLSLGHSLYEINPIWPPRGKCSTAIL